MYEKFLEYWGNALLTASKNRNSSQELINWISQNKDQLKYIANWVRQTYSGFEEMKELYYKAWGLDENQVYTSEFFRKWKEAEKEFNQNISDFFAVFGTVPMHEHQAVLRENKKLKTRVEELEKRVADLQERLQDKYLEDYKRMTQEANELMKSQSKEFKNLVETMSSYFWQNKST